jgi:periplasmic protein TonB
VEPPKIVMPNVIDGPRFDGLDVTPGSGSADGMLIPMVRVLPQYPRQASRDGIAGYVVFEVVVNPDGTVKSARPIKSQPRGVFEANAMQAIMKWKFRPRVVDGKAVEARGTQQIDFALPTEAKD